MNAINSFQAPHTASICIREHNILSTVSDANGEFLYLSLFDKHRWIHWKQVYGPAGCVLVSHPHHHYQGLMLAISKDKLANNYLIQSGNGILQGQQYHPSFLLSTL